MLIFHGLFLCMITKLLQLNVVSLETFPTLLDPESLNKLILPLESLQICSGQPDVTAKKERIVN